MRDRAASGGMGKTGFAQPISLLIIRYFIYVSIGLLAVASVAWFLLGGDSLIWPADWAENHVGEVAGRLSRKATREITNATVPSAYHWQVFDAHGTPLSGDMDRPLRDVARSLAVERHTGQQGRMAKALVDGDPTLSETMHYRSFALADGSHCVLAYDLRSQFTSRVLRDRFPNAEMVVLLSAGLAALLLIFGVALRAGHTVNRRLHRLTDVAGLVQRGSYGFDLPHTNIREINEVLDSFARMRDALVASMEQRRRSRETWSRQISALTHDIKTPLTVIKGNAELLQDTGLDDEQRSYTAALVHECDRMDAYVQKVLDLTGKTDRAQDASTGGPSLRDVDAREFTETLFSEAARYTNVAGVTVHSSISVGEGAGTLRIDPHEITRAVMNLVSNCVAHSPQVGSIDLNAQCVGEEFHITVRDHGIGFSDQALEHATEWLYQDDRSRHSRTHHGIGLSTAEAIVEKHHGRLDLSNHPLGGARVTIILPLSAREAGPL